MSVVVRMEMPKSCAECRERWLFARCSYYTGSVLRRSDTCPIICALPEGHGRLVDIDRKFLRVAKNGDGIFWNWKGSIADMIDVDNMRGVEIIVPAERRANDEAD